MFAGIQGHVGFTKPDQVHVWSWTHMHEYIDSTYPVMFDMKSSKYVHDFSK